MSTLFAPENLESEQLANRCTPDDLDEVFGQEKLLGKKGPLLQLIESDSVPSAVFYGPPGCGKTALAKIIAKRTNSAFIRLNAVTAKTDDLRKALKRAKEGDIVEVTGTHLSSKKEIPMAVKALGLELIDVQEENGVWKIRIKR